MKSYRLYTMSPCGSYFTPHGFFSENPEPGDTCDFDTARRSDGWLVTEFEGEPTRDGWESATMGSLVDYYYEGRK